MKVDEIRKRYLDFFKEKNHTVVTSDSLVPQNDPTLLFTGAGMNQFKEYFLGLKKDMKRATSSQKCLRTGDLEEVGRTAFHHSFFEMLGNFSFGDYFKKEAIEWAWEFLTRRLNIPVNRLRVTVHETDDEAYAHWKDKIGVRADWIYKKGDKSNFWPANAPKDGPNGPCGPCSEIYFDQDPVDEAGDIDNGRRFAEIWNLVFTQFDRQDGGKLLPLANKNIDTGMGLERLACVLQGKHTNYEIDSFAGILAEIQKALNVTETEKNAHRIYSIADHVRGVVMCLADGVIPSNEGRGYVIRKLIRRAIWHGAQISPQRKLDGPFLVKVVPAVVYAMQTAYPELKEAEASIAVTLKSEEERFLDTLETGLRILNQHLDQLTAEKVCQLPGKVVFELYDTYGFPEELTRVICEERGFSASHEEFESLMDQQRQRAKGASQISSSVFASTELDQKLLALPATLFLGYQALESEAKIIFAETQGEKALVVLDQTPFYAESGGQVGDRGLLTADGLKLNVLDTQKKDKVFIHEVEVLTGQIKVGQTLHASVDVRVRENIMRNHTATHLLHAALRAILGPQVRQLGSLVSAEKLRFDYSHAQALSREQLVEIEDSVNCEIMKNTVVNKEEKPIELAKQEGAIAFFGEKYGDRVRVVTVPGFSKEFCGGTHCDGTGQIGAFVIVSDSSVASGTRRIEALTGEGALEFMRSCRESINHLCQDLRTTPDQLFDRVQKLKKTVKQLEKDLEKGGGAAGNLDFKKIAAMAVKNGGYDVLCWKEKAVAPQQLMSISDHLRQNGRKMIYLLVSEGDEKIQFLLGLSQDLKESGLDLRPLIKDLSPLIGAGGGGRADLIQGGGPNKGQVTTQWDAIGKKISDFLSVKKS